VLASRDAPGGAKESYHLVTGSSTGDASLRVVSEYDRERPFLGFQVVELDKRHAEKRGLKPYSGLLVTGTYPKSSAEAAGVQAGDVLMSIDGKETVYLTHVAECEAKLSDGKSVPVKLLRGQAEMELALAAKSLKERVSDSQDVQLDSSNPHKPYAGVNLRGIPRVWCEKIYGQPRDAVVVTNVELGSPAWIAGIRGGDVIDKVDGGPVPAVTELSRRIAERGDQKLPMRWLVTRGTDPPFETTIDLHDYSGETNVWVPLVFWLENGTDADRWSVGPFGLVMSNKNHYVGNSSTRNVETRNVFSMILGLIHVETGPDETEVRLLWFIKFDT
jgi:C-terminal processing protease CtpA/Prc